MNLSDCLRETERLTWPVARLGEAIEWLARRGGLHPRHAELPSTPPATSDSGALLSWMDAAAHALGIEAEPIDCAYAEAEALLQHCGPGLLRVRSGSEVRFLAVLRGNPKRVTILTPALRSEPVDCDIVRAAICHEIEAPRVAEMERMLEDADVPSKQRAKARKAILRQQLAGERVTDCWLLRLSPGTGPWRQAREAQVPSRTFALLAAHTVQYLLWLLAWWMIGKAALEGRFDWGWLTAWALVLLSIIPFRLLVTWWQGMLAIRIGALLKRRLLFGALQMHPDEIRHQGAGQLLGSVIESEAVESLALSGGFLALLSGLELVLAGSVMAFGPAPMIQPLLLGAWIAVSIVIAWRYARHRDWWTQTRLKLTNDLVERMVGHRTRLAQERRETWHEGEDSAINGLLALALGMDHSATWLTAFVPRGWLLVGLLALAPAFALTNTSPAQLAVGLGGVLLAFRALQRLTAGLSNQAGAVIACKHITSLLGAASRPVESGAWSAVPLLGDQRDSSKRDQPLLETYDLNFCYRDRGIPVLRECSLQIQYGDRIILEGPSGGGKSTLASILTGLRMPDSGLLLLGGLDRQTVGLNGWRRHVAAAPQFHENHVLTSTFAFNLLMGSGWPPRPTDLERAEQICRDLGLDDLLKRMPAGISQLVGESGWQLSHGERSRLYIARALLQDTELVVLDESFASLDPENLGRALRCVLDHANTLMVIAHP